MKNVETPDKISLANLITEIKKGNYVIPDFQREFEWDPWDVRDLIKSIFMDYYIGTLLLWKASKENVKALSCTPLYAFEEMGSPQHIVLDGQQRLSAIHYAFFNHSKNYPDRKNKYFFFVNIHHLIKENYDDAFTYQMENKPTKQLLRDVNLQYQKHIFPMNLMENGAWKILSWINGYKEFWKNIYSSVELEDSEKEKISNYILQGDLFSNIIEELFNQYFISFIELDREISVAKVCDIFTNINSKGIPLNIFDLLNAMLRPYDIYLKEMWHKEFNNLNITDNNKMKIYILQVMSILEQNYCSSKYLYYLVPNAKKYIKKSDNSNEEIVLIKTKDEFETKWNESVKALKSAIKKLNNPRDYGVINFNFLPYSSIIPIFSSIYYYVDSAKLTNRLDVKEKIKKWYWSSVFTNKYSSAVESTAAKDFQDLKKWFDDDTLQPEAIVHFFSEYKNLNLENEKKNSAIYNAIFNLMVLMEAKDWASFDLPEYAELDDHHIVPHHWGKDLDGVGDKINSILNRTPLSAETNRTVIHKELPNVYLKKMFDDNSVNPEKVYKVLESHLISRKAVEILLRTDFKREDYFEFIDERKKSIIETIKYKIISNEIEIPENLKELNEKMENVEISIRDLVARVLNDKSPDPFRFMVTSDIQEKVNLRIEQYLKKHPQIEDSEFGDFRKKLDYFDLQEYNKLITSGNVWVHFESIFKNKILLQERFSKLGELRNSIRHIRIVNEVTKLDGEAAIVWFTSILN
jgi:hypothetical protein